MPTISQLTSMSPQDLGVINTLLGQLSSDIAPRTMEEFTRIINTDNVSVLGIREHETLVGIGTLVALPLLSGAKGIIEDVVVDESQRGKGLGKLLMQSLIALAREKNLTYLDLTSKPERVAANALYQALGFEKRHTNVYRLYLEREGDR